WIRGGDDGGDVDLTQARDAMNGRRQAGVTKLHLRGFDERLVRFDGVLQLRHLRGLSIEELRGGIPFGRQLGVATEIGLGVRKLSKIAIARSCHLVDLSLVRTRIDLREEVPSMHGLALGEVDADDLSLDLAAHHNGVVSDDRADAAKMDGPVVTGPHGGDNRHHWCGSGWRPRPIERKLMHESESTADDKDPNRQGRRNSNSLPHRLTSL